MKSFALAAALVMVLGMAEPADALPVTYDITLTATGIGDVLPVFGIGSLPAGPFNGSFSFDAPLTPSQLFLLVPLTAFSLTVGSETWSLAQGDVGFSRFSTDATGAIDPGRFFMTFTDPVSRDFVEMSEGNVSNLGWFATDIPAGGLAFCGFDTVAPFTGVISGNCIGGGPGTIALVQRQPQQVPEPASIALLAIGLAGALATRGRRRASGQDHQAARRQLL